MKFNTAGREKRLRTMFAHPEGQVLLCVPGSGDKQRDCVSIPFRRLLHAPQLCFLTVMGSLNTFSLQNLWPEWTTLLWASLLGTLSVALVRASWSFP